MSRLQSIITGVATAGFQRVFWFVAGLLLVEAGASARSREVAGRNAVSGGAP
jgi:hypothetical protein